MRRRTFLGLPALIGCSADMSTVTLLPNPQGPANYSSGVVTVPQIPGATVTLTADGAFMDIVFDGESLGGIDLVVLIQTFTVPTKPAAFVVSPNMVSEDTTGLSTTGDYTLARWVMSEVNNGSAESFTAHIVIPQTATGRGNRNGTCTTTHSGGGTSNLTWTCTDTTTPWTGLRIHGVFQDLTLLPGNALVKTVAAGGTTNVIWFGLGNN